ncbi:hypothetical protein OG21DRAFT_1490320 [Imleria badia]|nr:hypothetical protein OG21DRAFT_1490320 [Imleria badia]
MNSPTFRSSDSNLSSPITNASIDDSITLVSEYYPPPMNITFFNEEHSSQNPTPPRTPSPLPLPVPEPRTSPLASPQPRTPSCPIVSIDIPLQAHSHGHPSNADLAALVTAIEDAHLAIPIDSYLDVESPFYELLHTYCQNERLCFVHTSVPDAPEFHLAWHNSSEMWIDIFGNSLEFPCLHLASLLHPLLPLPLYPLWKKPLPPLPGPPPLPPPP